ncbi:hypothetical protein [Flavobacterium sp. PL02]|nr:hypothetical protein [Flavobacterium sp. PL02]MEA9412666.1 hypothetical protein [Flavobacterium sp. PL02]
MNLSEAMNIVKIFKNESVKETLNGLQKLEKTISISNFETIIWQPK